MNRFLKSRKKNLCCPQLFFCVAGALLLLKQSSLSEAQELRWNLSVGDRFRVSVNQERNSTTRVDKREVRISSLTTIDLDWQVTAIDENGNFQIQQSIQKVAAKVGNPEFPSQAISFDTDSENRPKKESLKVLQQVQPLIGVNFNVSLSPRGEITAVTCSEETIKLLQELPASLDLQSLLSEQGLKEILGANGLVLPENSPQEGTAWEAKTTVVNPFGVFDRLTKFKFARTEKVNNVELAMIELQTSVEPKTRVNEKEGKLNFYEESGSLNFDLSNGAVQSLKTKSLTEVENNYSDTRLVTTVENTNHLKIEPR